MIRRSLFTAFDHTAALIAEHMALTLGECLFAASNHPDMVRLQDPAAIRECLASSDDGYWPAPDSWLATFRPYRVNNGILTVEIAGAMLNNFSYQFFSWATGYQYIDRVVERGDADDGVKGIAFVINTGGGDCSGNFDLCDKLFARRGKKPLVAFINDRCFSAGYSIASCADQIWMTRTGGVGSIGVISTHVDRSKQNEMCGLTVTNIISGKMKGLGDSNKPLDNPALKFFQDRCDYLRDIFVDTVARNRGIDREKVFATEAACYGANEAIEIGLADKIAPYDQALAMFVDRCNGVSDNGEDQDDNDTQPPADDPGAKGEAPMSEVARISSILNCPEAKGREASAQALALTEGMSLENAQKILLSIPAAAAGGDKPATAAVVPPNPAPTSGGPSAIVEAPTNPANPPANPAGGEAAKTGANTEAEKANQTGFRNAMEQVAKVGPDGQAKDGNGNKVEMSAAERILMLQAQSGTSNMFSDSLRR